MLQLRPIFHQNWPDPAQDPLRSIEEQIYNQFDVIIVDFYIILIVF